MVSSAAVSVLPCLFLSISDKISSSIKNCSKCYLWIKNSVLEIFKLRATESFGSTSCHVPGPVLLLYNSTIKRVEFFLNPISRDNCVPLTYHVNILKHLALRWIVAEMAHYILLHSLLA